MAKSLKQSNRAHLSLVNKHKKKSNGQNESFVKMSYHSLVFHRQNRLGRVLSKSEKQGCYKEVISDFF